MKKAARKKIDYPFAVRPLSAEDGGGYLVEFPDLPGCMSDGETVEEAIRNGEEAARDWIAAMKEAGRPIPPPSRSDRYSGKWQMRVPRSLHRRLAERAKAEGVSLNTLAVTLMAEGIGERKATAAHKAAPAARTRLPVRRLAAQRARPRA